jgi:hypothetical protein
MTAFLLLRFLTPLVTRPPSTRLMIRWLDLAKALAIKWSRVDQRAGFMVLSRCFSSFCSSQNKVSLSLVSTPNLSAHFNSDKSLHGGLVDIIFIRASAGLLGMINLIQVTFLSITQIVNTQFWNVDVNQLISPHPTWKCYQFISCLWLPHTQDCKRLSLDKAVVLWDVQLVGQVWGEGQHAINNKSSKPRSFVSSLSLVW